MDGRGFAVPERMVGGEYVDAFVVDVTIICDVVYRYRLVDV